jgi:hypothetical protein
MSHLAYLCTEAVRTAGSGKSLRMPFLIVAANAPAFPLLRISGPAIR